MRVTQRLCPSRSARRTTPREFATLEQRRGSTTSRRPTSGNTTARSNEDPSAVIDALNQQIAVYKKDAATAERLAKQAASESKAKDTQLKRSAETIARLKEQVTDLQAQMKTNVRGDASKVSELEARVRDLEKQRSDVLGAFRKQIKLLLKGLNTTSSPQSRPRADQTGCV